MPAEKATIVSALRTSRDKLNHGGKHWIKGALSGWVRKAHRPGSRDFVSRRATAFSEHAFCSVGVLRNVKAPVEAYVALAQVIDAKKFEKYLGNATSEKAKRQAAERVIIGWNDHAITNWNDVKTTFTKAARRVSQRKG